MTTFYSLGARLSGLAAVVCAVLAVLSHPGLARADDQSDCTNYCLSLYPNDPPKATQCVGQCMAYLQAGGKGKCPGNDCSNGCVDKESSGSCGSYKCNNFSNCLYCGCLQISDLNKDCTCKE